MRHIERDEGRRADAVGAREDVEAVHQVEPRHRHAVDARSARRAAARRRRSAGSSGQRGCASLRTLLPGRRRCARSDIDAGTARRVSAGFSARTAFASDAPPLPPRSPCATARACSMPAIDTSVCAMIGRASVSIIAVGSSRNRPALQAADQVVAGELVADVDDVGAHGAGRERAVADLLEPFLPLSEVDGDRDNLGAIGIGQPRDGDRRYRARPPAPAPGARCRPPCGVSSHSVA